jgi:hypothetical protein
MVTAQGASVECAPNYYRRAYTMKAQQQYKEEDWNDSEFNFFKSNELTFWDDVDDLSNGIYLARIEDDDQN